MTTVTFDTHESVRKRRESGMQEDRTDVATKPYLDLRLEALKADMFKWIAGMLLAQAGLAAALAKLL